VPDLAYDPSTDTLYGWGDRCPSTSNDSFLVINKDTGAGTIIGSTGPDAGGAGNGLAVDPISGDLFATPELSLFNVNPATGLATVIPASIDNVPCEMNALDFQPNTNVLFGSLNADENCNEDPPAFGGGFHLVTINKINGITTDVGETVLGLDAIVFEPRFEARQIPAISEWGMIAAAGLGLICVLRGKEKRLYSA
jgi:hypothetical protein